MKFIVNSQQLHKQLQSLSGVISSSNTMPIISCFHFHLEENSLTIKTTDLTTTLMAKMAVETGRMESAEEVAVPSKMLLDILKTFDDVPLTFDVDPANYSIDIVSGQGQYRLAGMDAATYPTMPVAESTSKVVMNSNALVNAINKTVFATSNDEMHQQMSGIYCEMTPDGVTFVATDAHKLVRYRRKDVTCDESTNFILRATSLSNTTTPTSSSPLTTSTSSAAWSTVATPTTRQPFRRTTPTNSSSTASRSSTRCAV